MPYVPTTKERIEDAMPYILPAACGLIVLGVVGWAVWHQFGPKKTEKAPTAVVATAEEKAKTEVKQSLAADVASLEASYQRAVESGSAPAVLESLLTRTIERQRERLKLEPRPSGPEADKLARLEGIRGDLRAKTAAAESRMFEKAADEETARGAHGAALQKMREALRLQREANASAKSADLADLPRELRLTKAVEEATTGPLRETITTARTRAEAAIAAQDWGAALKAYQQARAAQVDFNSRSTENRANNVAALEQLDTEIASLQAADLAAKVNATEKTAAAAQAAGKLADAAAEFAAAARQQEELNTQYPKSRFASADKLAQLAIARETALSTEALSHAVALDREVSALLQQRQIAPASAKIGEATELLARVAKEFPRSHALDPALRRKFEYLEFRRADLAELQEQVYSAMTPVPGTSVRMLRTEVPQELYARVMNLNPSRNQGRGLPVDSVSWFDAREFCERLSWLLGVTVRLPREEEFRAGWKGAVSGREWSAHNAAGRSREIGRAPASSAGFQDLAGNVAEWLELPKDDGGTMPVAGGSFLDPLETVAQLPIVLVEKNTRARHIGFRFVLGDAAAK